MNKLIYVMILAFILDLFFGDPQNPLHPIRIIGLGIGLGIKIYKKIMLDKFTSFLYGAVLSIIIVFLTYFTTKTILDFLYTISFWVGFVTEVILCYFTIAANALKTESMEVYRSLEAHDIVNARFKLSRIVGRDTENLTQSAVIKATVETIAENLSDGVVAPILFMFVGGAPLCLAYKAVNTLDSMIGYHNDTYEYFGKFAARIDDAMNFIPARVSAVCMILATCFTHNSVKRALEVFLRDRYKHRSPNSAQTESVCAGALGIMLGGSNFYQGKLVCKPNIGDDINPPEIRHILEANRLMYISAVLLISAMPAASLLTRIFTGD